jgi:hypothetical protein
MIYLFDPFPLVILLGLVEFQPPFPALRFGVCGDSHAVSSRPGRGKYRLPSSLRYTEGQAFIDLLHPQRCPGVGCLWGRSDGIQHVETWRNTVYCMWHQMFYGFYGLDQIL